MKTKPSPVYLVEVTEIMTIMNLYENYDTFSK